MKRIITVLLATIVLTTLTACGSQAKFYNKDLITDWEEFNARNDECHVIYAFNKYSCFSDGSYEGNQMYKIWEEKMR